MGTSCSAVQCAGCVTIPFGQPEGFNKMDLAELSDLNSEHLDPWSMRGPGEGDAVCFPTDMGHTTVLADAATGGHVQIDLIKGDMWLEEDVASPAARASRLAEGTVLSGQPSAATVTTVCRGGRLDKVSDAKQSRPAKQG
mmetsp:Transcript_18199/g.32993  ORF Transcript_18199/g.32993 Transcript_18199/m.32993 type:complete len:140 (+) Transcript_18199:42-461(+)